MGNRKNMKTAVVLLLALLAVLIHAKTRYSTHTTYEDGGSKAGKIFYWNADKIDAKDCDEADCNSLGNALSSDNTCTKHGYPKNVRKKNFVLYKEFDNGDCSGDYDKIIAYPKAKNENNCLETLDGGFFSLSCNKNGVVAKTGCDSDCKNCNGFDGTFEEAVCQKGGPGVGSFLLTCSASLMSAPLLLFVAL